MRTTKAQISLISTFLVRCLDSIIPILAKSNMLVFVAEQAGRFESYLTTTPEDRFSCDVAPVMMNRIIRFYWYMSCDMTKPTK